MLKHINFETDFNPFRPPPPKKIEKIEKTIN